MSILEIKSHIEKETEREVQDILQKAEAEAKTIIEDAKRKAEELLQEQKNKLAKEDLAKERSELAVLRMSHKAELIKVKAQWLDRTFEEARKRLGELVRDTNSASYKQFVTGLVVEGAVRIKGSKIVIQSDDVTTEFLRKNMKSISKMISDVKREEVELQLESIQDMPPGVIVRSANKRQYYNNTLEARLSEARQKLSGELYGLLFKEGK